MRYKNDSRLIQVLLVFAVINTVALIALAVVFLVRVNSETARNLDRQERLVEEIQRTGEETEELRRVARALIGDTGQIREHLGMSLRDHEPPRAHREPDEPAAYGDDNGSAEARAFFEAFRELVAHQNRIELRTWFRSLREEGVFERLAEEQELQVSTDDATAEEELRLQRDGTTRFTVRLDYRRGELQVHSHRSGADEFAVALGERLLERELREYLADELEQVDRDAQRQRERAAALHQFAASTELGDFVESRSHVVREWNEDDWYQVTFLNEAGQLHEVPSLLFGYREDEDNYVIDQRQVEDFERFRDAVLERVAALEEAAPEAAKVKRSKEMIERAARDDGFRRTLEKEGLRLSLEPRDRGDHIHFDLYREESNERFGSFAVQRPNGELWIMDDGDVPLKSFRRFGIERRSEGNTTSFRPRTGDLELIATASQAKTVAVVGTNEGITDTIILAHANPDLRRIKLISVPRDLFYRGRRVNAIYRMHGPERFARELTEITGLPIDHYMAIDMYAFIDAVNILGGVEVTLDEDLIDPTYRTRDDGEWGTLYYPRGTHRLDGIEALRVVRSRATTDDFDRAARQQRVIEGVFERLSRLQITELATLRDLVGTLTRYIETDLTPFQIVRYLQRFGGYSIGGRTVLDTSNVLYHTYSNLYYSNKSVEEVDDDFDLGAWILLPEDDDWANIRRYVEHVVNGEEA